MNSLSETICVSNLKKTVTLFCKHFYPLHISISAHTKGKCGLRMMPCTFTCIKMCFIPIKQTLGCARFAKILLSARYREVCTR